jgi:hypothetical protein
LNQVDLYPDLWKHAKALIILQIVFVLGRPAQLKELVAITGGDDETVSRHCSYLATRGLLTRTKSHVGWSLTKQGFDFLRPAAAELSTGPVDNSFENPDKPVKYPDSSLSITINNPIVEEGEEEKETGKTGFSKSGFSEQNWAFFDKIGVIHNHATEFVASRIHPETVRAEWQKLIDKDKAWPGLLVTILTHTKQCHPKSCECEDCRKSTYKRYAEWDSG